MSQDPAPSHAMPQLQPLPLRADLVVAVGCAIWVVVLVVVMLVPSLHTGSRDWWPWVPATGAGLGLVGLAYLRLGRGNAAGQDH